MYADDNSGEMTYEKGDQSLDVMWGDADSYDGLRRGPAPHRRPPGRRRADHGARAGRPDVGLQRRRPHRDPRGRGRPVDRVPRLGDGRGRLPRAARPAAADRPGRASRRRCPTTSCAATSAARRSTRSSTASTRSPTRCCPRRRAFLDHLRPERRLPARGRGRRCRRLRLARRVRGRDARGRRAARAAAAQVLATSHDWPVLQQMDDRGDYPEVLWQLADQAAAGQLPDWYADGLGC